MTTSGRAAGGARSLARARAAGAVERVMASGVLRACLRLMFVLAAPVLCGVCIGIQDALGGRRGG